MTLLQKSGDGSVSDEVFNPVIDHLNAGGGSQPYQDLGVLDVTDVLANGPTTLYTPGEGEIVTDIRLAEVTGPIDAGECDIGPSASISPDDNLSGYARLDADGAFDLTGAMVADARTTLPVITDPIIAALVIVGAILPAVAPWQALHAYAEGEYTLGTPVDDALTVFQVATAGTSGATEPDWLVLPDQTMDGSVVWNDIDHAPTAASARVYIASSVPS